jgi:serine protease
MRLPLGLMAAMSCLSLSGCDLLPYLFCDPESDPECVLSGRGHIEGTIAVPTAAAASTSERRPAPNLVKQAREAMRAARPPKPAPDAPPLVPHKRWRVPASSVANQVPRKLTAEPRWRPGEVIVRGRESVRDNRDAVGERVGGWLREQLHEGTQAHVGLCNTDFVCLVELRDKDGELFDELATAAAANRLSRLEDTLAWAEVNWVLQIQKTPNDQYYPLQWHYSAMRLPAAWDVTTGSPDVVAAVIDTGVLLGHPELASRVIGGADLISDASVARDGDGRDNNAEDTGDEACGGGCHSFHGTHVAGTMAAESNNGTMVAGVAWEGSVLAVRVLGKGGGSLFDIAAGVYWSIGESVDGVRRNPNPADVLNMSLGGQASSQAMNEAIAAAIDSGAIVIVAAGNDNIDASGFTPANAPGAITVAAVGNTGGSRARPQKASYSNFGSLVAVAAPGGEQGEDIDGDGNPDGVLSTLGNDVGFYQGTSMAAPHVAGLAMLMKSLNPGIGQAEARSLLTSTADANVACSQGCGAGAVNAVRVLRAMQGEGASPLVVASPAVTRIGRADKDAVVVFENVGGGSAPITISVGGPDRERVQLDATSGTLGPDQKLTVNIDLDRTGTDHGDATLTATSGEQAAQARLIWTDEAINVASTVEVGALRIDGAGFSPERIVSASALDGYAYKLFNLPPGEYLVIGISDDDSDGDFEEHEGIGVYPRIQEPRLVSVGADERVTEVDFIVAPGFLYEEDGALRNGAIGAACSRASDCQGDLYCDPAFPGGYCTKDCSGGPSLCPSGTACFCLGTDGVGGCEYRICLDECVSDSECRTGEGYSCDIDQTCYPD